MAQVGGVDYKQYTRSYLRIMILTKLKNGWPDLIVSTGHQGDIPEGSKAFDSVESMEAWKRSNPDLTPQQETPPEPVPAIIPMWAFRRALRKRNLLTTIMTFIEGLPDASKLDAKEHLEYGNYIERSHHMIVGSASALGLPESVVDEIFREGSKEK